jgi:serine/threonine protein kinase
MNALKGLAAVAQAKVGQLSATYGDAAVNFVAGRTFEVGTHQYKVTRTIGEGGFAFVYAGKDERGNSVAIKLLNCASSDRFSAAKQEVALMRSFPRHSNLLQLIDAAATSAGNKSEVVMILEFCSGGSCAADIAKRKDARQPYRVGELWSIFSSVVDAVRVLHGRDIPLAHRDLKPENVLLSDADRHWKLCDFGSATTKTYDCNIVAQRNAAEEDIERNTTLAYRAPEMVDVFRRQLIDEEVDVWALGVLLFKIAYFEGPFENGEALGILNGTYYVPIQGQSLYEPVVKETIDWLLTNDPALRPTAEEVAERIAKVRGADYVPHAGAKALSQARRAKPKAAAPAASALDDAPVAKAQPKKPAAPAASDASALFSMLGGGEPIPAAQSRVAPVAATASVAAAAPAKPAAAAVDLFSFDAPAAAAPQAASSSNGAAFDPFGSTPFPSSVPAQSASFNAATAFGSDFNAFQSAPQQHQQQQQQQANFGGAFGGNGFGSFQQAPMQPASAAPNTGFGGFQSAPAAQPMRPASAPATAPPAGAQPAQSSVFALMQNPASIDLGITRSASTQPTAQNAARTAVPMSALGSTGPARPMGQQQQQQQQPQQKMQFDEFVSLTKAPGWP